MRVIACLLCASCFAGAATPATTSNTPDRKALTRRDLEVLCTAEQDSLPDALPTVAARLHDGQLKDVLFAWRDGFVGAPELFARVRELMEEAGVATCPALDRMSAPRR